MTGKRIKVWDLPTRLFHWTLAVAVGGAFVTAEIGGNWMECHGKLGLAVVGLLAFRLVWGVAGSTYARFSQFFPTPAKVSAYLQGRWQQPGHNPLGALSVFGLLCLLAAQAVSGLFANDDIAFTGPLMALVGKGVSDRVTGLHHLLSDGLIILIGLHLAAIVFYVRVKKHNLVLPMLTGWTQHPQGESARGGSIVALIVALVVAGAALYAASGAWLPPPPPPEAASPAW